MESYSLEYYYYKDETTYGINYGTIDNNKLMMTII